MSHHYYYHWIVTEQFNCSWVCVNKNVVILTVYHYNAWGKQEMTKVQFNMSRCFKACWGSQQGKQTNQEDIGDLLVNLVVDTHINTQVSKRGEKASHIILWKSSCLISYQDNADDWVHCAEKDLTLVSFSPLFLHVPAKVILQSNHNNMSPT